MGQVDFAYAPTADSAGCPVAVSIFADRPRLRAEMQEDVATAGLTLRGSDTLAALLEGEVRALGDVILVDCPQVDGARLAALARLDMRVARSGARLVLSTSVDALDDVFACCDQSAPEFLVDPGRSDRVIALGRVLGQLPRMRLKELSEEDRLTLLRLVEQVGQIAERLEKLTPPPQAAQGNRGVFRFEGGPQSHFAPERGRAGTNQPRPASPLPDPRLVRRIIRQRQLRARFFDGDLFADPAWDMLLDLTAARGERNRVSVTSLCIASGVPPTTALRWIGQMTEAGLLQRIEDITDRRRAFIALTDDAADAMARYFAEIGASAGEPV